MRPTLIALCLAILCAAAPAASACGRERWPVKTGTDKDVQAVDPVPAGSTIARLGAIPAPVHPDERRDRRFLPTEGRTFLVTGTVVLVRREKDDDYHIVLSDGGQTMIVEAPAPACAHGSRFEREIAAVRRSLDARLGGPLVRPGEAVRPHWRVTVTGIAFFDTMHHQTGVAANGIELHPMLGVRFR